MELITDQSSNFSELKDNKVYGHPVLKKTSIKFNGKGNILVCEDGVILEDSNINFNGNDSLLYLSKSQKRFCLNFSLMHRSSVYVGSNNYFNGRLTAIVTEERNLFIGNDSLFSFGITIRSSDAHRIYDITTKKRINYGKDIVIGDHVWVGQDVFVAKNTKLGSGCIVGAKSVISGKRVESNTVYAGNPAKKIKEGIFFTGESAHQNFEGKDVFESDTYIYEQGTISCFNLLEFLYESQLTLDEKIQFFKTMNQDKNRFYIGV